MPVIPAYIGVATWPGGSFRPSGRAVLVGGRRRFNPAAFSSKVTWSARLFVGLSVKRRKVHTVQKVVTLTKRLWLRDASFVAQKGLWTNEDGRRIVEDSVQIIVLNLHGATPQEWRASTMRLAEQLCGSLSQEMVVLEIQRNGIVKETIGVVP